jgi:hypothetical protein
MSIHNRYANIVIVEEDFATFDTAIDGARTTMAVLPPVNAVLLKHVAKIGTKTETFTRQTLELARLNPGLIPVGLNITEVQQDLEMRDELRVRYLALLELANRMRGAMRLLGSDAYTGALAAYRAMKVNNRNEALTESIRELGRVFKSAQTEQEEPVEPEEPVEG